MLKNLLSKSINITSISKSHVGCLDYYNRLFVVITIRSIYIVLILYGMPYKTQLQVKIEYNSERRKSSLDFLATPESNLLTSLPFEPTTEEPIKSENPYAPSTFLDEYP